MEAAVDDHRVDVRDVGRRDHRRHRIDHRGRVEGMAVDDHDVGLLARSQRPGPVGHSCHCGAVDRRETEDLASCQQVGRVDVIRPGYLVATRSFGAEERPHLAEHVARAAGHDVVAETGPEAVGERLDRGRPTVGHLKLNLGRDRYPGAGVGGVLPLLVGEMVGVDVRRPGVEQIHVMELLDHLHLAAGPIEPDMHRDRQRQIARKLPVVPDDLRRAEARTARGHGHGHEALVRIEVLPADPARILGLDQRAVEPPIRERSVGESVCVYRSESDVPESADGLVGMLGRVGDVRPVQQSGDAGVDALERTPQVAGIDVLGPVVGRERVQDSREVLAQSVIGGTAADRRLPGVAMSVDEAWDDDVARGLEYLGALGAQVEAYCGNPVFLDENVGTGHVAQGAVHREDEPSTDQDPLRHGVLLAFLEVLGRTSGPTLARRDSPAR